MVIDSSALIALLLGEAETEAFIGAVAAASSRLISAPTYLETAIVMVARAGPTAQQHVDQLVADLAIDIVPFTREQAALAVRAYRQYGKGSGHAAGLNFGDCFTYALAKLFYLRPRKAQGRACSVQGRGFLTYRPHGGDRPLISRLGTFPA